MYFGGEIFIYSFPGFLDSGLGKLVYVRRFGFDII